MADNNNYYFTMQISGSGRCAQHALWEDYFG